MAPGTPNNTDMDPEVGRETTNTGFDLKATPAESHYCMQVAITTIGQSESPPSE